MMPLHIVAVAAVASFIVQCFIDVTGGEIDVRPAWRSAWVMIGLQVMHIKPNDPDEGFPEGINGHTIIEVGFGLFTIWCQWTHRPKNLPPGAW